MFSACRRIDNIEALKAFEYGYLFKMIGYGYGNKYTTAGNDSRGIDVAVIMREETRDGKPIEFVRMTSHAHLTRKSYEQAFVLTAPQSGGTGFTRGCPARCGPASF
jgi:hypothetical protein